MKLLVIKILEWALLYDFRYKKHAFRGFVT